MLRANALISADMHLKESCSNKMQVRIVCVCVCVSLCVSARTRGGNKKEDTALACAMCLERETQKEVGIEGWMKSGRSLPLCARHVFSA